MLGSELLPMPLVFPFLADESPSRAAEPEPEPEPDKVQKPPLSRSSSQLDRWSRGRAIRSGRRIEWPATRERATAAPPSVPTRSPSYSSLSSVSPSSSPPRREVEEEGEENGGVTEGKEIYMVSDGTGWTAEHSVIAALGQFEHSLVDRSCPVNTHLFSGIVDMDKLLEIIKQAAKEGALFLYTLADPSMADSAKHACKLWGVPATDILRPTTEAIAAHLGVAPSGIPRGAPGRKGQLTDEYFRRIEAIDFSIKQDDGAQTQNLHHAHIVLVGVSRTGKTPLSIYLAQKGYKVANVPIVMGVELPKTLSEINQEKVFALTISPAVLHAIRTSRANTLGLRDHVRTNYSEMDHVREELDHANQIFAQNPTWPVIDVTGKAIEETAAVVVRIYHDRKHKGSMPRISRRFQH
ncbi:probable pyruvate, phosphate dikinase regulatory protein, chloroplastic isoform X2 [Typha angustifolia]|uniref:probable pyruvate, phosphate dikinase regulatory protein, chloroplastic isoform X2 n=1 Tax=Typha angustifolia TaxID=59011 RepID=UPI003C2DA155